jgi:hypothetical protein
VTVLHSAIVTTTVKLGEKASLITYAREGRQSSTILNKTGASYRLNSDLSTPITANLSAQLRYRLNIERYDTARSCYYNRGRLVLSYAFNKNWSADMQDTLSVEHTTAQTSQAKYTNENYAGVTYKF